MSAATIQVGTAIGPLAVHERGNPAGETILFWPALFTSSLLYEEQVAFLSSEYRLLLIDPPGVGDSPDPQKLLPMDDCAKAVVQILDHFGLEKAHLVGTSWGGIVGAILGRIAPERFTSLALCNTPFDHGSAQGLSSARTIVRLARIFGSSSFFANGVAKSFFAAGTAKDAPGRRRFLQDFHGRSRKTLTITGRSVLIERQSLLPALSAITVPTLVIAGALDTLYPSSELRSAAERIPRARFVELPNSGHVSACEVPAAFNSLLSDWLREHRLR
jgi:3-oxoadipate enol-lactonase